MKVSAQAALTRRRFVTGAGVAGVAAATGPLSLLPGGAEASAGDGTPEQIHLTFGVDPATTVFVSWASPAPALHPRVHYGPTAALGHSVPAQHRSYRDGLNGETVHTYHAMLEHLPPDALCHYAVTADNDRTQPEPFAASFRTAPRGPARFRWTSFGDLATPQTRWTLSSGQARHAVDAVERFEPLFHLLNGDLCYANLNWAAQPSVWADFGRNNQRSAAHRPWMPCPGNHEIEFCNGAQGQDAYLARYSLPDNGTAFPGRWYAFRVGTALFISLNADDVIYQEGGPMVSGPAPLVPAAITGNEPLPPGSSIYIRGYSGGAQTRWLERTLAAAAGDRGIDWIIVQMHQVALSSSQVGNGSDRGLREAWLPLFDRYGVDLVLCGHDHDYERSWPVRGCNHGVGRDAASGAPVDTLQPKPVITATPASGTFDTRHGTIHLVLGGGGTASPCDVYGVDAARAVPVAKVITKRNAPIPASPPGTFGKPGADAVEDAIWSASRDTLSGYGLAVFDLDPGVAGGPTTITIRYYHSPGADRAPDPHYELFETTVLAKEPRARV